MLLHNIRHVHLIGICGTAMATLAAMLQERGFYVTGSDQNVYPPMSTFLQERNIAVASPFSKENLIPKPDLVVVGNAMSRGNVEVEAVLNERMNYISSADLMCEIFIRGKQSAVVTGTHGKTTTTSIAVWLLSFAGLDPTFMVGGIPKNFQSSYRLGNSDIFVCEGDEYDTAFFDKTPKFLHYLPTSVIINNIEFDHADIYSSLDEIELQFRRLVNIIPANGLLLAGAESEPVARVMQRAFCAVQTFGLGDFYWSARNLETSIDAQKSDSRTRVNGEPATSQFEEAPGISFDIYKENQRLGRATVPLVGEHNARNALAAAALALNLGVGFDVVSDGLRRFAGVKRRLDLLGTFGRVRLFDDFAHHPTAVRETLNGLKMLHPGLPIYVAFEPRSATSRRRIFQQEFAQSLSLADTVLVSDLFEGSKIADQDRLDPSVVVSHLRQLGRQAEVCASPDGIVEYLKQRIVEPSLVVVMSNGGFGGIHQKLSGMLADRFGKA
ncbi:MAG TPA: Mur ligase family protein [Acidobacteriota bacterium]|jgi:UDP-N-acetylmuramate: L-alanyl-gamma-D-glutamyl-meso-diaminopimelate ligase